MDSPLRAGTAPDVGDVRFFGHPTGLGVLAFTEGFIGFSNYGMQSLLVLYMTGQLLRPDHLGNVLGFAPFRAGLGLLYGPLAGEPLAAAIMGLYSALIYATPIVGGLLADRLLGRTRTIVLGAVLMTAGHFMLAFDASFLVALLCLVLGMGCAGTIKAQVGGLYSLTDLRRADAFQIFTLSIQLAVIVAPLICGTLGERYAWHWGFAAAGAGMLIGLLIYLAGRPALPPDPLLIRARGQKRPRLTAAEWRTVAILVGLLPILAVAAIGNMEIFNAYLIWGQATYDHVFFGFTLPVSWLLSLDAFISTFTLLGSVLFWRWMARRGRDPDEIIKIAIGAAVSVLGPLVLAVASLRAAGGQRVSLGWGVTFHIVNDIGFANLYAVGLALYSRAAPPSLGATIVNAFVLHLFLANLLVGKLGGLLVRMPAAEFWAMHAALIAIAALLLLLAARLFRTALAPRADTSIAGP